MTLQLNTDRLGLDATIPADGRNSVTYCHVQMHVTRADARANLHVPGENKAWSPSICNILM